MAETRITDCKSSFGHIVPPIAEQLRGAFHSDPPKKLRDRHAHFLGKDAAQIKLADADLASQFLQRGRLHETCSENCADALHALASEPFLTRAKQFRRRRKEKLRHSFEDLALVPERLRCRRHRRLAKARSEPSLRQR